MQLFSFKFIEALLEIFHSAFLFFIYFFLYYYFFLSFCSEHFKGKYLTIPHLPSHNANFFSKILGLKSGCELYMKNFENCMKPYRRSLSTTCRYWYIIMRIWKWSVKFGHKKNVIQVVSSRPLKFRTARFLAWSA